MSRKSNQARSGIKQKGRKEEDDELILVNEFNQEMAAVDNIAQRALDAVSAKFKPKTNMQ